MLLTIIKHILHLILQILSGGEAFTKCWKSSFCLFNRDTDYVTDLGIAVAADTIYKLRIEIDSNRQVQVYVNDTLYGLSTTEGMWKYCCKCFG